MTTASVMTYDSLVENIQSYLERTDAATLEKIPLFIMLAEQIIASQIIRLIEWSGVVACGKKQFPSLAKGE